MISIASTKNVVTKGRIRVNHGQCAMIAKARAAVEIKNNNQYKPLELLFTSMIKILRKNKVQYLIISIFKTNLSVSYYFKSFYYFRRQMCLLHTTVNLAKFNR